LGDNDISLNATSKYTEEVHQMIVALWNDDSYKEAFNLRYEFHIPDGVDYFLEKLDKLNPQTFVPSSEDVLHTRRKTIGIIESKYIVKETEFIFVDVGGQRNERKKWPQCFENVNAVLFVTALSDYDQKCYEDDETNRLQESLTLFQDISNGKWFSETTIILILNKVDVFKNKLKKSPMSTYFEDYDGKNIFNIKGGDDFDKAYKYLENTFRKLNKGNQNRIYPHLTCATNLESVTEVFNSMTEILIKLNIGKTL
jgi:guanine nucleotide-binding protein G(i) subunit alpha